MITERLELLRELVPGLHRLAVIVRHDPGLDQKLQDIRSETQRKGIEALILNPAVGDCMFGPNRRNSRGWTDHSQRFRLTLRVNNHR